MTLNKLHKLLGDLIAQGHGRLPVCVRKDTFTHNLEDDGCVILPVVAASHELVLQIDDDGGTKINANGRESYRQNIVLFGGGYEPAKEKP